MFDSLSEFNLSVSDRGTYKVIHELQALIEKSKSLPISDVNGRKSISARIQQLMTSEDGNKVFALMCHKMGFNPDSITAKKLVDKLPIDTLIKLILLAEIYNSVTYVADILDIDSELADELLNEFKSTFRLDDLLTWLASLLSQRIGHTQDEKKKKSLLLTGFSVNQAADTREEAKLKERRNDLSARAPLKK